MVHQTVTLKTADANDLADRLPAAAAAKLRALRMRKTELGALASALGAEAQEARTALGQAEADLARRIGDVDMTVVRQLRTDRASAEARMMNRLGVAATTRKLEVFDTDPNAKSERARVERHAADLARLTAAAEERGAEFQRASRLLTACEQWLLQVRTDIAPYAGEPARPKRAESLERVAAQRAALLASIAAAEGAPLPPAELKRRLRAQVDSFARASITIDAQTGEVQSWPTTQLRLDLAIVSEKPVGGFAIGHVPDTLAILAMTRPDDLVACLERAVNQMPSAGAMSPHERVGRIETLTAELVAVERAECDLHEAGGTLPRSDIDVRAYLGVQ